MLLCYKLGAPPASQDKKPYPIVIILKVIRMSQGYRVPLHLFSPAGATGSREKGEEEAEGQRKEREVEEGGQAPDQVPERGSSPSRSYAPCAAGPG